MEKVDVGRTPEFLEKCWEQMKSALEFNELLREALSNLPVVDSLKNRKRLMIKNDQVS